MFTEQKEKAKDFMVRWSYMVGEFSLARGSILVTYLSGINYIIFNKIFFSYSTKLQYTNFIQIESHLTSRIESIEWNRMNQMNE